MASTEERLSILKMIQDGKITPEEGVKLLDALDRGDSHSSQNNAGDAGSKTRKPRWMRVIVTDLNTNKEKINIRLPANVIDAGYKMGARYIPGIGGSSSERIVQAVQMGEIGKLIDVCDEDSCERVIISLE